MVPNQFCHKLYTRKIYEGASGSELILDPFGSEFHRPRSTDPKLTPDSKVWTLLLSHAQTCHLWSIRVLQNMSAFLLSFLLPLFALLIVPL